MSDPIEFNVSLNEPVNFNLEVGNQGPKGDKGDTGSKGETGDHGEKGDPGTTDYNQLQNKPQLDIYLKKSEANTTTADLLNKINQNTDSINDTKSSLRNYALTSDVNGSISEAKTELNEKISQAETRINNAISQAKIEINGKFTEADNKTSSLDTKFTKLTSDNKADITQLRANLNFTNSALSTHKEQVDKNLDDIKVEQTDQDTLISDILNAFSAESEKGTDLKLNSSATKVLGLTIYGNTEQNKYTGKNLLQLSTNPTISNGLSSTVSGDGLVKYSGKITDSWGDITTLLYFPAPLPIGKYTFSIDHPRTHRIIFKYRLADNSFSEVTANMTATSTSNTFTTTQPIVAGYLYIAATNGSNLNDTVKAQLEIGDTATDYEPYTGGYNNLFDEFSKLPKTINGLKLENVNGILKLTGMPTSDWNTMLSRDITDVLNDKTNYTVMQYNTHSHKLYPAIVAYKADGSGGDEINAINSKVFNFKVDKTKYNRYVMKLQVATRASFSEPVIIYNNYALFVGNYTENNLPEYSPCNQGLPTPRPQYPQVVKELSNGKVKVISKNLLKVKNLTSTQTQAVVVVNPDNSITVSDVNKNNWGMNITNDEACPRIEQGTKVTMSIDRPLPYKLILSCWTNTGGPSFQFPLAIIDAGSTSVTNVAKYTALSGHLLFSLSEIGKQINETFKVQLEYGDTATPFVPHESSVFTIPSGLNIYKLTNDIYDEVKLENGVAKMIKRVGKLELSGEEYFRTINAENPGQFYVYSNVFDTLMKNSTAGMCTHFDIVPYTILAGVKTNKTILSTFSDNGSDLIRIMFSAPDATNLKIKDVNSFKNWLKSEKAKGTPVTIYYEMKTPTEEEITDPTLLAQLKKLMEARTYDGLTNISVTGTDLTPDIKVKYMRKIN